MGRAPCCDKANVKKGPWSPEEDSKLKDYIEKYGTGGNWIALPQKAGLKRCGKSCRLRWLNYLRPNIKHGEFTDDEDRIICSLFSTIGSRWSIIAAQLPGRTDNDIKNYWNTKLKKKLMAMTTSQSQRKPPPFPSSSQTTLSSLYKLDGSFSRSFTAAFEPISQLQSDHSLTTTTLGISNLSLIQTPDSLVSQMQSYHPVKENFLMFGSEPSCSSSDGSCSQISYGREIKQEDLSFQGFGAYEESSMNNNNHQNFMLNYGSNSNYSNNNNGRVSQWCDQDQNQWSMDYNLEDVKRLISSSNTTTTTTTNLLIDENKTQEKVMYYYY